ncbi:MAG: type 1 glutamine amidotransferase [Methylotenera sp.]|nr:type 1 glutamine amidotransferase [Methylotenera sp.]
MDRDNQPILGKMKSVLIFRFSATEEPGYLETFLGHRNIIWQLVQLDAGHSVPEFNDEIGAIAMMGGPMSVNDKLPWIEPILDLIRAAIAKDVPVIGHCLGGQLLAKALGAEVKGNACKEMGWGEVRVVQEEAANEWFGGAGKFDVFHWHYETFAIPKGATRILNSRYCKNQAFVFNDRHIGFQCHIEMTEAMVRQWCDDGEAELVAASGAASVQTKQRILLELRLRIAKLNDIAADVYSRWLSNANL